MDTDTYRLWFEQAEIREQDIRRTARVLRTIRKGKEDVGSG
jgi:hypothetical protein